MHRIQVKLTDIRNNPKNPRKDFGDIEALADTFEVTGGEPLNPPIVVCDGDVYRIVDGERRVKALKLKAQQEGTEDVATCTVLASLDMAEASELASMLATDDKRNLTDSEKSVGVQEMLLLGVPEADVSRASGISAGKVHAARRAISDVAVQCSIDQLAAAAEVDDEEARRSIIDAAPEEWEKVVKNEEMRLHVDHAAAVAELRLRALRIRIVDGPENPARTDGWYGHRYGPRGYQSLTIDDAEAADDRDQWAARIVRDWDNARIVVWHHLDEEPEPGKSDEEIEKDRELAERTDRYNADLKRRREFFKANMGIFSGIVDAWIAEEHDDWADTYEHLTGEKPTLLYQVVYGGMWLQMAEDDDPRLKDASTRMVESMEEPDNRWGIKRRDRYVQLLDLLKAADYEPSEDESALYERLTSERSKNDDEGVENVHETPECVNDGRGDE